MNPPIRLSWTALWWLALALAACTEPSAAPDETTGPRVPPETAPRPIPRAMLPADGGPFGPTRARMTEGPSLDAQEMADVAACAPCHADLVEQWRASAHGDSSFNNSWYRGVVDKFREDAGVEASRLCGGCHEPLLTFLGSMEAEIAPSDPMAHAGITCIVCHSIESTTADGNGSYVLNTTRVPIPTHGDPESVGRHRTRLMPRGIDSPSLCAGCHRGFLAESTGHPFQLPAIDEPGHWRSSAYAGSVAALLDEPVDLETCQSCHMPAITSPSEDAAAADDGTVRSHHFAGGDTARPAGLGNEAHLRIVQEQLQRAVEIDVVSALSSDGERTLPADGAPVHAGDALTLDVVIRNESAGHRFPGGVRDTQDTWVEVRIVRADGTTLAEAGTDQEHRDDPTAFVLRTMVLDEDGQPEFEHLVHRFRAVAYDHSVPVRGARVVRYTFDVPDSLPPAALPLRVEARLRHRRHSRAFQAFVCRENRRPRGRAFAAASRVRGHAPIDPCRAQPVTVLATSVVWLGAEKPGEGGAERPTSRRLFDYSLGLLGDVQDRLDYARPSIARGLEAAGAGDPRQRAMFMALRARLEARQGRLAEALDWAGRAEELVGEHAALWRIRGRAYAQVWQWESAATALEAVARLAPEDSAAWRDLAQAHGSAGHDREALAAAQTGLTLLPRDESLLRSQALALEHLGSADADAARESWLAFRHPDDEAALRARCSQDVPGCERERQPVPTYRMRQPAPQ